MKKLAFLICAVLVLTAQTPILSPQPGAVLHLVYQWGFNTNAAKSGPGTGTTVVDVMGPASDGGVIVRGTDWIWNTVRARQTNVCELYPNGRINCNQAPNALSPIQLTLFPLIAQNYFTGLNAAGTSTWNTKFKVTAAVLPAASSPYLNQAYTWDFEYKLHGQGPIANAGGAILVKAEGTFTQEGGFFRGKSSQRIAFDPVHKFPLAVSDTRTHIPQRSVYSNDLVDAKLLKATRP